MITIIVLAGIAAAAWYYWPQIKAFVAQAWKPLDGDE